MLCEFWLMNDASEIARVRHEIEKVGTDAGLSQSVKIDLQTVVDEILSNIIKYGFKDGGSHEIQVSMDYREASVKLQFVDDGIPFNPLESEQPDVSAAMDDRRIGGLGIHFVKHLVDDIEYRRHQEKNHLTIVKNVDL